MVDYTNEAGEPQDEAEYEERINKYAKRFVNVFLNLVEKESLERKLVLEAMSRALIVETVANEIEIAAQHNLSASQVAERLAALSNAIGVGMAHNYGRLLDEAFEANRAESQAIIDEKANKPEVH